MEEIVVEKTSAPVHMATIMKRRSAEFEPCTSPKPTVVKTVLTKKPARCFDLVSVGEVG